MAYFIRRYQKGVAQSGTTDVFVSDSEIPISMFCEMAEMVGPGKIYSWSAWGGYSWFQKDYRYHSPRTNYEGVRSGR